MIPLKIISGGQTGADRGALDFAIAKEIPHGGTCPRGRKAEDGVIPGRYQLQEHTSSDYPPRTKQNVEDADGTIIFLPKWGACRGTRLTVRLCAESLKPCLVVEIESRMDLLRNSDVSEAAEKVMNFLHEHRPQILNVAGPRESTTRGIHNYVFRIFEEVFDRATKGPDIE